MDALNPIKNMFQGGKKGNQKQPKQEVEFEDDILNEVVKDFEQRKRDRQSLELQWRLNMNFYDGNQFVYVNRQTKNVEEVERMYWYQEMEVFNQIAPIIETRLSKLGRLRPIQKTRPATNTDADINNSKVCNKLLESYYYDREMRDQQSVANTWSEVLGGVIWKNLWNEELGGSITNTDVGILKEGDAQSIPINYFEIYPDSIWHENIKDCKSIIHAKAYTVEEIKEIWGKEVPGSEVNVLSVTGTEMNSGTLDSMGASYKITNRTQRNSALVIEKWERPSKKYPNGRLIICTEKELLLVTDLPYLVGEDNTRGLPFVSQKSIKVPGRFFGKSIIERLIPLQRRYNSLKNRKAEYYNRVTIGQLVYEEGSIDEDFLEEEGAAPGAMIPYKQGFNPPRFMEFHNLPSSMEMEEQNILHDFIRISGVSEISRDSSAPTGVSSGRALGILQEQDETRLSLTASYITDANIEIGKQVLRLYKQFADTDRVIRSVGENLEVEILTWDASNITSDDVYIESQSQSIESPSQRRNMVFELLQYGLYNDPETGRLTKEGISKLFDVIDLGNWEAGSDTEKLHISKADRENQAFVTGKWEDIDSYDDHMIHIQRHNRFRLTSDFEKMIAENPNLGVALEYHVMQHAGKIQEMNQPQMPVMPEQGAVQ